MAEERWDALKRNRKRLREFEQHEADKKWEDVTEEEWAEFGRKLEISAELRAQEAKMVPWGVVAWGVGLVLLLAAALTNSTGCAVVAIGVITLACWSGE